MRRLNHSWGQPFRPSHHATDRCCKNCGVVKRTRKEVNEFWTKYWHNGLRLDGRPDCVERASIKEAA